MWSWYSNKNMKYNALNLLYLCLHTPSAKSMIGSREHENSVDVERIFQWNKNIVGIVNFVRTEG
jgi:hypothetical protein